MKIHSLLSLAASLAIASTSAVYAGSAPYSGKKPEAASQPAQPAEQTYSYHCWARAQDGTEYATAVISEPTPHDKDFATKAKDAWVKHLSDSLGLTKVNARCGEAPTSTVSTWGADSPNTKHVDWQYQP